MLRFSAAEVGAVGSAYLAGAVVGRAAVRLSDRPVRPPQIVLCHLGALFDRDRRHRLLVGFRELRAVPLCDRRRHRRRVRGDQLGDPGTGAGAVPRAHRSGDQRQLLAGRRTRRGRRSRVPAARPAAAGYGLARRVRDRRGARPRHPGAAQLPPGKPALADAARPARRGRGGDRRDRAPGRGAARQRCYAGAGGFALRCPRARRSLAWCWRSCATIRSARSWVSC